MRDFRGLISDARWRRRPAMPPRILPACRRCDVRDLQGGGLTMFALAPMATIQRTWREVADVP
jgi:hypothetical protein